MTLLRKRLFLSFFIVTLFTIEATAQARKGGGGAAGKSGGFNKSAGGSRGGFQQGGAGRGSSGLNSGPRATGGFAQPGTNSSSFQNSMSRIRAGGSGPGAAGPREGGPGVGGPGVGGPGAGAPGNPSDRRNNRTDNRTDNRDDRRDIRDPLNGASPFSAGWYADHPNAWRFNNPRGNVYAVAAAPNMYGWWGLPVAGAVPVGAPVGAAPAATAPAAGQQAANAASNNTDQGEWLPLGVFSLAHDGTPNEVTRALQLATSKTGEIKGNHVDLLTDTTSEVHGRYDAETKTIHWTIGNADSVVFNANVDDFKPGVKSIPVVSHYANGSTAKWVMTPIQNPDASEEKTGE